MKKYKWIITINIILLVIVAYIANIGVSGSYDKKVSGSFTLID